MKRQSSYYTILIVVCVVLVATVGVAVMYAPASLKENEAEQLFTVQRGDSVRQTARNLKAEGLVRFEYPIYLYFRLFNKPIKAGAYRLSPAMSIWAICACLQAGTQALIKITVPEGLTISKTAAVLEEHGLVSAKDFLQAAKDKALLHMYGIVADSAEGFLFPDTYFFSYGESAARIVMTMLENFFDKTAGIPHFPPDPAQQYKAVILASIIEREYRVPNEASKIAGVFLKRLAIGMALQSCATVEYILTEVQHKKHPERLFNKDLKIEHPYNTYQRQGLPPGPIASPGMTALYAACNPEKHDYLYFRLENAETGSHVFTKSLDEHAKAGVLILKRAAGHSK